MTDTMHRTETALTREGRRTRAAQVRAERRQDLIVNYLFAAEEAEQAPRDAARSQALTDARRALAAHLVVADEYPTVDAATAAVDARTVRSMPRSGVDYSKVVPF